MAYTTIDDPSAHFQTALNAGNNTTDHNTANDGNSDLQPDLVWIKNRSATDNHKLTDAGRGATEELESNTTDAEVANAEGLTAFASDGFALGDDDEYNTNTEAYASWNWLAGTAPTADNSASAGAIPTAGSVKIDGSNLGSGLDGSIAATRLSLFRFD